MAKVQSPPVIAVVEDDLAVLHSLAFALETQGYRVATFANAAEALDSPALREAACLIIDYGLPDLDGAALLSRLREQEIACPAIFIASNPSARCRAQVSDLGAPLIEKPLMGGSLEGQIRALI